MPRLLAATWLPIVCICLNAVGCSSLSLKRPTAEFQSARVGEITPQGMTFNFDVRLTNPNSIAVPLAAADYSLALSDVMVVKDTIKPASDIPANGDTMVTLPVSVTFDNLLKAQDAIRRSVDVPFAFSGDLSFTTPQKLLSLPLRVPFEYRGTLPVRQVLSDPAVLLNNPAARKLAGQALERILGR